MNTDIVDIVVSRLEGTVFPVVKSHLRDEINRMLVPQLKSISYSLTPLSKQLLVEAIVKRFRDAAIKEHEPVGVNAALTTGENITQSSLQSHHQAGLKRGASGFDRIEEITNMKNKSNITKVITTPHRIYDINDNIHEIPRSKSEINELANLLVSVTMDEVIISYTILSESYPEWYELFSAIQGIPLTALKTKWMRIYLNKDTLYRHRISLNAISLVISENIGQGANILYPPSQLGLYIDIHMNTTEDADYYLKLSNILSLQVGGIDSVESATPIPENLLTNLRVSEVKGECDGTYELTSSAPGFVPPYAWERMIKAMIPDARIIGTSGKRFCSSYTLSNIRSMMLQTPLIYADVIDKRDEREDGTVYITFREDIVDKYPYLEHANLSPRVFTSEDTANKFLLDVMVDYHFFWYIEAICERVQDLYVLPEIDSTRTYTTSAMDCRESLGYMAMRTMLYREFRENININHIHVELIINTMTLYKDPISIRRQSVRNDKSEWITYTTFEDILKYITAAAFAGEDDHMNSVSAQILTGQPIAIGRGGVNMKKTSKDNPTGNVFLDMKIHSHKKK